MSIRATSASSRRGLTALCAAMAVLGAPVSGVALSLSVEGEAVAVKSAEVGSGPAARYRFQVHQCESWIRSEWRSASGELVAWDEVEFEAMRWRRYRLVRPNLAQDFLQEAPAGRRAGMADEPFLAGPMLIDYAARELAALRAGATREVRYLVAESGQSVKLRLRVQQASATDTVVGIDAANVWLRPLIPSAQLRFDAAGRFHSMNGQILPQGGTPRHPLPVSAAVRVVANSVTSRCHN